MGSTLQTETPASAQEENFDLTRLDAIVNEFKGQKGAVIPILQRAQDAYGYLPKKILQIISQKTSIPLNQLYGVATFYAQFHMKRRGKHLIRICDGTACHVRNAAKNVEACEKTLGVPAGGTSPDYRYTLEIVYCLGSCGLAPIALVDQKVFGRLAPEQLVQKLKALD